MGRRVLPAVVVLGLVVLGLALVGFAPAASATHWAVGVTYGPTTVFMETDQTFTLTLRNDGPDPVAVANVAITFDWVTSGFRYTVSDTTFNLAPANEQTLTRTIPIPRLVTGSLHSLSVFITAQTNGDFFAEEKEYTGQVTAQVAPPPAAFASALVLCGAGIVVGIVILVLIIVLVVRRRPRTPPAMPTAPAVAPAQACPTCGRPITFVPQYQRWYCPSENKYI